MKPFNYEDESTETIYYANEPSYSDDTDDL